MHRQRQFENRSKRKKRQALERMQKIINSIWEWFWSILASIWLRFTAQTLDFGSQKVKIGRQIAEGGFSFVFIASDVRSGRTFALKRVHCGEREIREQCRAEARVHQAVRHGNCMPLLGLKFIDTNCYMLFPYYNLSLRSEINRRIFDTPHTADAPWSPSAIVQLAHGIARGLQALHEAGYSHRDLKPENVLLTSTMEPTIMDFGSAGPVSQSLISRRDVNMAVETASTHTTMPYRPPELLEAGSLRQGDPNLDYTAVDVWSFGCLVFAVMFGTSPSECEFQQDGRIRIVQCTQLSILKDVPVPPAGTNAAGWYPAELYELVRDCLVQNRMERPTVFTIIERLEKLINTWGGTIPVVRTTSLASSRYRDSFEEDDGGDGIALV